MKVTVPKRTGRKRKRGSDAPFEQLNHPAGSSNVTAPDLLQRLRDSDGNYSIEALGILRETHRFRTLADFQLRNSDLPIMRKLRDHVMTTDYERLKDFSINLDRNTPQSTAFPGPPSFVSADLPFKYEYEQATGVVFLRDESGNLTSKNTSAAPRRVTWVSFRVARKRPRASMTDEHIVDFHVFDRAWRRMRKTYHKLLLLKSRYAIPTVTCSRVQSRSCRNFSRYDR